MLLVIFLKVLRQIQVTQVTNFRFNALLTAEKDAYIYLCIVLYNQITIAIFRFLVWGMNILIMVGDT